MVSASALSRPKATRGGIRVTALIVAAALFMEQLDGTVLATALPTMAKSFHVGPLQMNVALTSYLLSLAVFIPASGRVADRYGCRTVFRAAIAIFVTGSVLCAQSGSLGMLVASRVLQGLGGAMMMPVGRLVLLRTIPRAELVRAMGWVMVPGQIGPVLGPPLGGAFVTYLSWHWIFYINVPIGLFGMVMVGLFIPDVREDNVVPFDWLGFVLSGVALASLMFGFELASRGVAPPAVSAAVLGAGFAAGALYIRHARHSAHPILNLRLMDVPSFAISVFGGSLTRITAGALPFLLPMAMQLGLGMSAARSGLITFASAAGAALMKACAAAILRRFGFRHVLVWNGLVATLTIAVMALLGPGWPLWLLYAVIFAGGFFQSLQFTAFNTVAYADVPASLTSSATSFYATFQQLMLSAGICVAAAALAASVRAHGHAGPQLGDFSVAWLVVSGISLLASPVCARFAPDVGDDMSGRGGEIVRK
jgi:EmrB/QacA subfamily drug resistance transporter